MNIVLAGSGRMSTALANIWTPQHEISIVTREKGKQEQIRKEVAKKVRIGDYGSKFVGKETDVLVLCAPTRALESVSSALLPRFQERIPLVMTINKGIYRGELAHNIIERVFGQKVLHLHMGGASFDEGLRRGEITVNHLACRDLAVAKEVVAKLSVGNVSFVPTNQVEELETVGAMKSIGAVLAGMVAGLELGENARALVFGEFFRETRTFFQECKLKPDLLEGPGIEDLFLCCSSETSNHYRLGKLLGRKHYLAVNPKKRYRAVRTAYRVAGKLGERKRGQLLQVALDLYSEIVVSPSQELLGAILNPPGVLMEIVRESQKISPELAGFEAYVTLHSVYNSSKTSEFLYKLAAVESLYDYFEGKSNPEEVIRRIVAAKIG